MSKIDAAFGIHAKALLVYGQRAEVIANNMANSDTPGYKARDIDFRSVLNGAMGSEPPMLKTSARHIDAAGPPSGPQMMYRVPLQPSADGNTVDAQTEQAQFAQNAIRHQASFTFLDGTIKSLMSAIKGE